MRKPVIMGLPIITLKGFANEVKHSLLEGGRSVLVPKLSYPAHLEGSWTITSEEYILKSYGMTKDKYLNNAIAEELKTLVKSYKKCGDFREAYYKLMKEGHDISHAVRIGPRRYAFMDSYHFLFYRTGLSYDKFCVFCYGALVNCRDNNVTVFEIPRKGAK